jgi:hypothetical protein
MPRVFISFVHEDIAVAHEVQWLLESELNLRSDVFLSADKQQVYAGDDWLQKVKEVLTEAEIVLLMLSRRSIGRSWVNFEAGGAWLQDKAIIPCCYGRQHKDALPHPYSAFQAIDLPADAHYLLTSVHHHLGLTSDPPQSPFTRTFKYAMVDPSAKRKTDRLRVPGLESYDSLKGTIEKFEDVS